MVPVTASVTPLVENNHSRQFLDSLRRIKYPKTDLFGERFVCFSTSADDGYGVDARPLEKQTSRTLDLSLNEMRLALRTLSSPKPLPSLAACRPPSTAERVGLLDAQRAWERLSSLAEEENGNFSSIRKESVKVIARGSLRRVASRTHQGTRKGTRRLNVLKLNVDRSIKKSVIRSLDIR